MSRAEEHTSTINPMLDIVSRVVDETQSSRQNDSPVARGSPADQIMVVNDFPGRLWRPGEPGYLHSEAGPYASADLFCSELFSLLSACCLNCADLRLDSVDSPEFILLTLHQSHLAAFPIMISETETGQIQHQSQKACISDHTMQLHLNCRLKYNSTYIHKRPRQNLHTNRSRIPYVFCPFAAPPSPIFACLLLLAFKTGLPVSNCLALPLILNFSNVPTPTLASEPGPVEEQLPT
jgi:hypothetical protein